jgi:branched-chain amino acid transport system substrate-binding protein
MKVRHTLAALLGAAALGTTALPAAVQAQEQFIPLLSYRVGDYAAGGSGFYGGMIDYFNLINAKGGVNGVKITFEECETGYVPARAVECYERLKKKNGGAVAVEPLGTGAAYGLLDRVAVDKIPLTTLGYGRADSADGKTFPYVFPLITTYWSQMSGMIKYLGSKEGGIEKLKGKTIVHLYHDSAYGKEPIPVLDAYAAKYGFNVVKIPIPPASGTEQGAQWAQIRQAKPDYVILWGYGVMNTVALKTARKTGFPISKVLGVWWAGSEEDVIPAGDAANNYVTTTFTPSGSYPLVEEIRKTLYNAGKGNLEDKDRIGSVYHLRGLAAGIMYVEAMRMAQDKYGKGKLISGEQMRWGFENLNIDEAKLKSIGAAGMMPTVKTSCADHEGSGAVKVQKWNGKKWEPVTKDWIVGDRDMIQKMVQESSAKYAADKKITPACAG